MKPNILDIKLGTVLYSHDACPEKVERMKKTAANTTSLETGVRLTGFQVCRFDWLRLVFESTNRCMITLQDWR